jgi:hypothetical protein
VPHDDPAEWTRNEPYRERRERQQRSGKPGNLWKELRAKTTAAAVP